VGLEHPVLLCLGGVVLPVPLRLCNGAAGVCRKRVLGVVPQVEPPSVPAVVRAGQRHPDVVVTAALLHPKVGAANRHRAGSLPQEGEPKEVPKQMLVCTDAEEPLAHCLEGNHLLDVVRVEVLELQPVCEQHSSDESAALVEGHERHHIPPGRRGTDSSAGTIHSTASVRGGSWPASMRRRSCKRETVERTQLDITPVKPRAS
jgi:hypothetical protein